MPLSKKLLFANLKKHSDRTITAALPVRVKQTCCVDGCHCDSSFYCRICETISPSGSLLELKRFVYCSTSYHDVEHMLSKHASAEGSFDNGNDVVVASKYERKTV